MKLIPLHEIFYIKYGNSFDLNAIESCAERSENTVNYVSRTRENNGVSAYVKKVETTTPFKAGLITVAGSGDSVLESFIQHSPFYTGYHVFILEPKQAMADIVKLFYCYCIRKNQYKYGFGRQANKTLKDILVPENIPPEFANINIKSLNTLDSSCVLGNDLNLNARHLAAFNLNALFKITGSKTTPLADLEKYGVEGCPYITTQATNNGISGFYNYYTEDGDIITFDSAVIGYCAYQPLPFSASDHVEKLIPKFKMNKYIALFLVTILNQEQYRFNYGRKCSQTRMRKMKIKLPSKNNAPDWQFMENYIKSLPYSSSI